MSELVVRGLEKSFGAASVLRGLDLTVPSGSLCAVLGPSGCGKTTLLRVVAGFEAADAGSVALDGRVVSSMRVSVPPERRRVGVVPQEGALFPHLSVAGNVAFGLGGRARTRASARSSRVAELLDLVGLAGYAERMPAELSGGQQQRVALARALAPDPALVLLDEPFSALDSGLHAALREDVRAVLRVTGATAVLVTHDQQEALSIADRVAVLRDGAVVQASAPDELYLRPVDVALATFVGEAVVLPAVAHAGVARTALGELRVRDGEQPTTAVVGGDRVGEVVIRPEQLVVGAAASGVPARVRGTTFYGHDALVQLELIGAPRSATPSQGLIVSARTSGAGLPDRLLAQGEAVGVCVAGEVSFYPTPTGAAGTAQVSAANARPARDKAARRGTTGA